MTKSDLVLAFMSALHEQDRSRADDLMSDDLVLTCPQDDHIERRDGIEQLRRTLGGMTDFSAITVFAGLPVRNLATATAWYREVFGREPDSHPAPGIADYYLAEDRDPERGTLQLREDAERAGGGLMTINVEDISVIARTLEELKVPFQPQRFPIEAVTVSAVTVGTFEDPDGNAVTIVQPHRRPAV